LISQSIDLASPPTQDIRVVVLGYVRPEMRFSGFPELLNRIKLDISIAATQLEAVKGEAAAYFQ